VPLGKSAGSKRLLLLQSNLMFGRASSRCPAGRRQGGNSSSKHGAALGFAGHRQIGQGFNEMEGPPEIRPGLLALQGAWEGN